MLSASVHLFQSLPFVSCFVYAVLKFSSTFCTHTWLLSLPACLHHFWPRHFRSFLTNPPHAGMHFPVPLFLLVCRLRDAKTGRVERPYFGSLSRQLLGPFGPVAAAGSSTWLACPSEPHRPQCARATPGVPPPSPWLWKSDVWFWLPAPPSGSLALPFPTWTLGVRVQPGLARSPVASAGLNFRF